MINFDELLTRLNNRITRLFIPLFLLLLLQGNGFAQTDSTEALIEVPLGEIEGTIQESPDESIMKFHRPKKATIMSAALPGLGQIYNKKYWKVPIIYGGFAIAGYYLHDNLEKIDLYKTAFQAETDGDPNTINDTGFSSSQLADLVDRYKTWRDLSYIAIGAIYILNIIDANVDAHLFYFDVGDDLSMDIRPFINPMNNNATGVTLTLKL